ncbi:response regulator transcription factor [Salinispira pacifica]
MFDVVIADDEPYILNGLEKKLPWNEFDMRIAGKAANGLECLETVRRVKPDLVITDIRMPGLTGLELIERLLGYEDRPIVVFMSGYAEFEYARRAIELGALSYLLKPIGQKELRNTMQRARAEAERRRTRLNDRRAREENSIIEFISSLPPGIDRKVVLDRIGMKGRQERFVLLVADRAPGSDGAALLLPESAECVHLPSGEKTSLFVVCHSERDEAQLTKAAVRLCSERNISIGASLSSSSPVDFPLLLRQARAAYHSRFVTDRNEFTRYSLDQGRVLSELLSDFERLFSLGDEARLRRLAEQLPELCRSVRPAADEILAFVNAVLTSVNRVLFAQGRPERAQVLLGDVDQMVGSFTSMEAVTSFLCEQLDGLFDARRSGAAAGDPPADLVGAVKQHVQNNLDSELNADTIASRFGVEKSVLVTRFRSETDTPLGEFIRGARMDHACFLLQHTRLSIQEVSQMCGYDDYFYFARLFRNSQGMSASEYRRMQSKPHAD